MGWITLSSKQPVSSSPSWGELLIEPGVRDLAVELRSRDREERDEGGLRWCSLRFGLNWIETTILLVAWAALIVDVLRQRWMSPSLTESRTASGVIATAWPRQQAERRLDAKPADRGTGA